ncbi:hypothetical protein CHH91_11490 [Virgibacillus sp. 7505]|uniref:hypothetical protein n=1 Tax=Virgibacillus sp. 7505 TaxID=2022548 RepID=UPI000BA724AD|nr:hypothetical protein [Virgibacillus sp. 7505]PAE16240.1 hypothetical protein CHH91_11490 [Virgibacillus sp. 7505]
MYELKETDLTKEAYRQLMERLLDACDTVSFAVLPKKMKGQKQTLHRLLQDLEPYLQETVLDNGTRANLFDANKSVPNYYYRICTGSKQVILKSANSLSLGSSPHFQRIYPF